MLKQKMYEAVDGLLERVGTETDAEDAHQWAGAVEALVRAAGDPGALDWLESRSGGDGAPAALGLSDGARALLKHLLSTSAEVRGRLYMDIGRAINLSSDATRDAYQELLAHADFDAHVA